MYETSVYEDSIVIADTETTGLGNKDEVIQIAGIVTDKNFTIKQVFNRYCFTNMKIHPDAQNTHGITRESLYRLSEGKYLEDVIEEIPVLKAKGVTFTFYNSSFDTRIIRQTLMENGALSIDFGPELGMFKRNTPQGKNHHVCAMKLLQKVFGYSYRPKLTEIVIKKSGFTQDQILKMYKSFVKQVGVKIENPGFHDALFDSFAVWLLLSKNRGLIYG